MGLGPGGSGTWGAAAAGGPRPAPLLALCCRNSLLEAELVQKGQRLPAPRKTGTTIAGVVYKVRQAPVASLRRWAAGRRLGRAAGRSSAAGPLRRRRAGQAWAAAAPRPAAGAGKGRSALPAPSREAAAQRRSWRRFRGAESRTAARPVRSRAPAGLPRAALGLALQVPPSVPGRAPLDIEALGIILPFCRMAWSLEQIRERLKEWLLLTRTVQKYTSFPLISSKY